MVDRGGSPHDTTYPTRVPRFDRLYGARPPSCFYTIRALCNTLETGPGSQFLLQITTAWHHFVAESKECTRGPINSTTDRVLGGRSGVEEISCSAHHSSPRQRRRHNEHHEMCIRIRRGAISGFVRSPRTAATGGRHTQFVVAILTQLAVRNNWFNSHGAKSRNWMDRQPVR